MRVYHFVSEQYGRLDLEHQHLKVARLHELNDPFEQLCAHVESRADRVRVAKQAAAIAVEYGLLCFSRERTNPVQWSHYADRHAGLCIGFDVPDELLLPVRYVSERTRFDPSTLQHWPPPESRDRRNPLLVKFAHWRYENEVRCVRRLADLQAVGNLYFAPFSDTLQLREVWIGHRCRMKRAELKGLLAPIRKRQRVSIEEHKARLAFQRFNVVKQQDPARWR